MSNYFIQLLCLFLCSLLLSACHTPKKSTSATVINLSTHQVIGTIYIKETQYGLIFQPSIIDPHITPGLHGFHVHTGSSCAHQGQAAGGHFTTHKNHQQWDEQGHTGDLPNLYFDKNGHANLPILSNRLQLKDIQGKSLIIHDETDHYANSTHESSGGKRIACAMIAQVTSI